MKKKIFIYEKTVKTRNFLKSFFEKRRDFKAEFVSSASALRRRASANKENLSLCIIAAEDLEAFKPKDLTCPVLAIISGDPEAGIRNAVSQGAENYILKPFYKQDLEHKIKSAFDREMLIERLKKEAADLQAVNELAQLASSSLDPGEILYLTVKKISEVIDVTRCSIIRVDGRKRYAHVVATYEDPNLQNLKLDLKKYPEIQQALTTKEPLVIDDVKTNPVMKEVRDLLSPMGIRSIIVMPIVFHEDVIGTLFLRTSRRKYAFDESEINLCSAIANASAHSLYNAFLFEDMESEKLRLKKASITDYLTGIYNIRYFYQRLSEEFSRAERHGQPLSCLMLDLDYFKKVNDKYGHKAGDTVLREIAQVLKKLTRKSDVLARYGGEEFVILLTDATPDNAAAKAEALRVFIENYKFHALKSRNNLSVSIGISSYPIHKIKSPEELLTRADSALYIAKNSGRNRIAVYSL